MKVELSHDALAKSIYEKASQDDKQLLKVSSFIKERYLYYKENKTLLIKKDIELITPYISKVDLSVEQEEFIKKSQRRVQRRRNRIIVWLIIIQLILAAFIIYIFLSNKALEEKKGEVDRRANLIKAEEKSKLAAEKRADSLMQARIAQNPEKKPTTSDAQLLIDSYGTLIQVNKNVKEQKHIAQSATLSSLAQDALSQDVDYAFKLAAKSWQLNNENKQACQVLYDIGGKSAYNQDDPKKKYLPINEIIENERSKGRGDLSQDDMYAIFDEENTVVSTKKADVKSAVKNNKQ